MTVNGKSFTIIKLLGKGKGGYSYLTESGNNRYVLKQIHHEPCDYYQFGNKFEAEIRDYRKLKEIGIKMPVMLETDISCGRGGMADAPDLGSGAYGVRVRVSSPAQISFAPCSRVVMR